MSTPIISLHGFFWTAAPGRNFREENPTTCPEHSLFSPGGIVTAPPRSYDAFLTTIVLLNAFILLLYFVFFYCGHGHSGAVFALVLLCTGPIVLFRFEPLVAAVTLVAWYLFFKHRWEVAPCFLLGLATIIKVYPVILMPVFLFESMRERRLRALLTGLCAFSIGVALPLVLYSALGGSVEGFMKSVAFHKHKGVLLEGLWANIIVFLQYVAGQPLRVVSNWGIHGLLPDLPVLGLAFFNWFWVLPYTVLMGLLFSTGKEREQMGAFVPFIVILQFVLFSKTPNPQYLWWFVVFFPMIPAGFFMRRERWAATALLACTLILTQVFYPVYYSEFLDFFRKGTPNYFIFTVNVLRNVCMVLLLCVVLPPLFRKLAFIRP